MGIETGSIGVVISAGPAISGGIEAGGLAGAASVSGLTRFDGPAFGAAPFEPSFGSVIEGPVRGSLEGFRTMNILDITKPDTGGREAPLGEINFVHEPLDAGAVISEAEAIIAEARINPDPLIPQPNRSNPVNESFILPWEIVSVQPKKEAARVASEEAILAVTNTQPQSEVRPGIGQAEAVDASSSDMVYQTVIELVEQVARPSEEKMIEKRKEEDPQTKEQEGTEEVTVRYVEDEEVARTRIYQLGQAIDQVDVAAQADGIDKIEGSLLKQFFAPEDSTNRSPIAQPSLGDGGLEETYQQLAGRDYGSVKEAKQAVAATVDQIKPVKKSKGWGKLVKGIDIARARKDQVIKSHPSEEVVARIVKIIKTVEAKTGLVKSEVTTAVKTEQYAEGRIEDQPDLAAVFQKAA